MLPRYRSTCHTMRAPSPVVGVKGVVFVDLGLGRGVWPLSDFWLSHLNPRHQPRLRRSRLPPMVLDGQDLLRLQSPPLPIPLQHHSRELERDLWNSVCSIFPPGEARVILLDPSSHHVEVVASMQWDEISRIHVAEGHRRAFRACPLTPDLQGDVQQARACVRRRIEMRCASLCQSSPSS